MRAVSPHDQNDDHDDEQQRESGTCPRPGLAPELGLGAIAGVAAFRRLPDPVVAVPGHQGSQPTAPHEPPSTGWSCSSERQSRPAVTTLGTTRLPVCPSAPADLSTCTTKLEKSTDCLPRSMVDRQLR